MKIGLVSMTGLITEHQEESPQREPNVLPLVSPRNPILRQKAPRFDFTNPPVDPIELAYTIADSMIAHKGHGLAANQIGLPYRCFALFANPVLVVFNPFIIDKSSRIIEGDEGCLTYPNLFVKVSRADAIKVRYAEPTGQIVTKTFAGLTARAFQHEIDHLDGIIMTDYVSKYALERAVKRASRKGNVFQTNDFK